MSIFFVKSILFFCIKAIINHLHRSRLANGRTWPKILGEWAWQGTKLQTYLLQGRGYILRYFYGNLFFLTADLFLCINSVHKNSWFIPLIIGTSMYYYTACNCTMCNLFSLGKSHFFESKCSPINSFYLFFNCFYVKTIFVLKNKVHIK